jgi:hypothetical protein
VGHVTCFREKRNLRVRDLCAEEYVLENWKLRDLGVEGKILLKWVTRR